MTAMHTHIQPLEGLAGRASKPWKRHPKYRDSGVEWLGEVPEHWTSSNLRWISRRYAGGTPDRGREDYWTDGSIPWINSGSVNQGIIVQPSALITEEGLKNSSAKWVPEGALVMALAGQGKTKGMTAITGIATTCNQSMAAIVPETRIHATFLFWWLTSRYRDLRGLAGDDQRDGLNLDVLGSVPCPLLPIPEQRAIAAFLDRETGRIDALIAKKERQIELLQEKRQALITHAVTKGLDPTAKMKDSGVEWIGWIPAHWEVKQFRRVVTRVDVGIAEAAAHAYSETGVPIVRSTNVRPNKLLTGDLLFIEPWFAEKNRSKYLYANDLVTVRTGTPGTTAIVPPELDRCQCFTLLMSTLRRNKSPRFFAYFLNSTSARYRFEVEGWGTAQLNISVPILQEQMVLDPPNAEQDIIADSIDRQSARLDASVMKIEYSLTLLREYRMALISAAVTGKIDVREATTYPEIDQAEGVLMAAEPSLGYGTPRGG